MDSGKLNVEDKAGPNSEAEAVQVCACKPPIKLGAWCVLIFTQALILRKFSKLFKLIATPEIMLRADNDPSAPDGKKSSVPKRLFDRLKGSKSTKSNFPSIHSMEDRAAPGASDGKRSISKRLFDQVRGGSKFTKGSSAPSTPTTHSMEHLSAQLAVPAPASVAQLAVNVLGVGTAPAVSGATASAQVVPAAGPTLVFNVDQGNPVTPAAAGPTSVTKVDQGRPTIPATTGPASVMNIDCNLIVSQNAPARNPGPVSLMNINACALPGLNVPQEQSKFKEGLNVALDGCLTALRVAKEASEWNPFLKAALGGIMAVIDLAKTVSGNSQDMKDILDHIQGILPILETSAKHLEGHKDGFAKGRNLMNFASTMQTELKKIQQMQSHGLFRRVLQGTPDADTLQGIYKNISEALEQFK
ncbi:hypothetical protein DXG01_005640, partial [Tephrocybe rancida]